MWSLVSALFDPLDPILSNASFDASTAKASGDDSFLHAAPQTGKTKNKHVAQLRRKHALSKWLQAYVASDVLDEKARLDNNVAQRILSHLSANQIATAAQIAADYKNYRLASLIAQGGGDLQFQDDLASQVKLWEQNGFSKVERRPFF